MCKPSGYLSAANWKSSSQGYKKKCLREKQTPACVETLIPRGLCSYSPPVWTESSRDSQDSKASALLQSTEAMTKTTTCVYHFLVLNWYIFLNYYIPHIGKDEEKLKEFHDGGRSKYLTLLNLVSLCVCVWNQVIISNVSAFPHTTLLNTGPPCMSSFFMVGEFWACPVI